MPAPNEAIPSCRAQVFILPKDGTRPLPLGLVEDFSITKNPGAENFRTIGSAVVPDNVNNIEEGRLRWGKVHTVDEETMRIVTPRIRQWTAFKPFNILVVDPETQEPIAMVIDARPESVELNFRGGAAARQQYSALCRYSLLDREVQEAAA